MSDLPPSEQFPRPDVPVRGALAEAPWGPDVRVRPEVQPSDVDDSEISVLLNMLWRRKGVISAVSLLLSLVAATIIWLLPPRYEASAVILLNTRPTNIVDIPAATVRQLLGVGGAEADIGVIHSEMAVLRSPHLAEDVIERLHLLDSGSFWERHESSDVAEERAGGSDIGKMFAEAWQRIEAAWAGLRARTRAGAESDMGLAVRHLSRNLSVSSDPRSYVIRVTYTSKDPTLAVAIANALADTYLREQLASKQEAVHRANVWLNDRVAELRARINRSEGALERFKDANGLSEVRGVTVNAQQLAEINSQLIIATSERAQKESLLRQIEALKASKGASTAAYSFDSPVIRHLQDEQADLSRRYAELSSRLGPSHPQMISLDAEQRKVQKRIEDEVNSKIKAQASEVAAAQAREATLRRSLAQLQQSDSGLGEKRVELRQLEQEAEANRLLFANLLNRSKAIENEGDVQQPDARIIASATMPGEPAFPQRKFLLFLSGVGAILMGLTAGLGCEVLDRTFRSVRQLERITMRPCIGLAPNFTRSASADELALRRHTSPYADAIRSIRIALGGRSAGGAPQVVLVTSAVPQEGKTIFALSLARSAAQAGYRSLLIDCDLRNPSVGRLMRARGVDLISLCRPATTADTASANLAAQLDPLSGMCFVPTAGRSDSPQDLLNSPEMREFLKRMRRGYDLIVLDTPPVLAATDALVLSRLADTTVFLARWGLTPRAVSMHALRMLAREGASVAGTVLSRVDLRKYRLYGASEHGHFLAHYASYYRRKEA